MRVERFKARTMREAMTAIKAKLGEDAVILHSRTINDKIEIIAAIDEPQKKMNSLFTMNEKKEQKAQGAAAKFSAIKEKQPMEPVAVEEAREEIGVYSKLSAKSNKLKEAIMEKQNNGHNGNFTGWEELLALASKSGMTNGNGNGDVSKQNAAEVSESAMAFKANQEFSEALRDELKSIEQQKRMWLSSEKRLNELKQEIAELKEILLRQELADLKQRTANLRNGKTAKSSVAKPMQEDDVYTEFFNNIKTRLLERGLTASLAELIVTKLQKQAEMQNLNVRSQTDVRRLRELLAYELRKFIKVSDVESRNDVQRIVAFVGPAGSGKTTTGLKLALSHSIYQDKKVAFILVNKSEEKTPQHLSLLAGIAKLPFAIVTTPNELKAMIKAHEDKELVVIDFAMEQDESEGLEELSIFLNSVPPTETHLVLPANLQKEQTEKTVKHFSKVSFDHVVFSKLDEMTMLGSILELSHVVGKPISYICNGEDIPEDIEVANATKLTYMILKG